MKHFYSKLAAVSLSALVLTTSASALSHTVVRGDTMWKLAVQYQVGTSEIIASNPQVSNPDLIYPGQILTIPEEDAAVTQYEQEVIRLVNEIRAQNGLSALTYNWELSRVARYKSQDMVDNRYFSHTSPTYGTPFQMIRSFGSPIGAPVRTSPMASAAPQLWSMPGELQRPPGQYSEQLLYADRRGYVANGHYWTQMFIG